MCFTLEAVLQKSDDHCLYLILMNLILINLRLYPSKSKRNEVLLVVRFFSVWLADWLFFPQNLEQ